MLDSTSDVLTGLVEPPRRLGVAHKPEEPAQESEAISPPESEAGWHVGQAVSKGARVVTDSPD